MIAYFDTSALIPLLVEEDGSARAARVWDTAAYVTSIRIVYAEARAALAHAARTGRLKPEGLRDTVAGLDDLYAQLDLIDTDDRLIRRAGSLAQVHALRGCDALHLAGAERLTDETTILVAGDQELCQAARALGLAVADTSPGRAG